SRQGRNYREFADARKNLRTIIDGRVQIDDESGRWSFRKGNQKFAIGVTAEGVKKIAILDTLLSNRHLDTRSIIFIDEPESALHPKAISEFMNIIMILAQSGIQFFLASHSYFVIKKLFLLSQQHAMSIPVLSAEGQEWKSNDLIKGMPNNSIIDESISLYEEEVELSLS
ncbi:MAG: ATP-binding protein, partial [Spirochaetales bacterium]|nr:ATP-binding protein [Spirochaetales bacterium]